jgi:hypothetical protein
MNYADPLQQSDERKRIGKTFNEVILSDAPASGNKLRRQILETNQSVRDAKEQMGHLESGSLVLQIPELDYYVLLHRFPELNSTDPTENKNAWNKFLCVPESEPYRVRKRDGKRARRDAAHY